MQKLQDVRCEHTPSNSRVFLFSKDTRENYSTWSNKITRFNKIIQCENWSNDIRIARREIVALPSFPTRVCKQEASVAGGHWAILIQQRSK